MCELRNCRIEVQGAEEGTLRRRKELQTSTEEINKSLGITEINKKECKLCTYIEALGD
jgi:hypothetical protein